MKKLLIILSIFTLSKAENTSGGLLSLGLHSQNIALYNGAKLNNLKAMEYNIHGFIHNYNSSDGVAFLLQERRTGFKRKEDAEKPENAYTLWPLIPNDDELKMDSALMGYNFATSKGRLLRLNASILGGFHYENARIKNDKIEINYDRLGFRGGARVALIVADRVVFVTDAYAKNYFKGRKQTPNTQSPKNKSVKFDIDGVLGYSSENLYNKWGFLIGIRGGYSENIIGHSRYIGVVLSLVAF